MAFFWSDSKFSLIWWIYNLIGSHSFSPWLRSPVKGWSCVFIAILIRQWTQSKFTTKNHKEQISLGQIVQLVLLIKKEKKKSQQIATNLQTSWAAIWFWGVYYNAKSSDTLSNTYSFTFKILIKKKDIGNWEFFFIVQEVRPSPWTMRNFENGIGKQPFPSWFL